MAKVKLKGMRSHGRMMLSGFARNGINIKNIPPYFEIEIDTNNITVREKEK